MDSDDQRQDESASAATAAAGHHALGGAATIKDERCPNCGGTTYVDEDEAGVRELKCMSCARTLGYVNSVGALTRIQPRPSPVAPATNGHAPTRLEPARAMTPQDIAAHGGISFEEQLHRLVSSCEQERARAVLAERMAHAEVKRCEAALKPLKPLKAALAAMGKPTTNATAEGKYVTRRCQHCGTEWSGYVNGRQRAKCRGCGREDWDAEKA
jgi:ribosomal protein S27E